MIPMTTKRVASWFVASIPLAAACGSNQTKDPDYGYPPPPPVYDAGPGAEGGFGSGSGVTRDSGAKDSGVKPGDSGPQPMPESGFTWNDAVLYYVFVDRFNDSNPANNCSVAGVSPAEGGGSVSPAQYQGGDWAGLTQKVTEGYFTDLGVNALIVSGPMQNAGLAGKGIEPDMHYYSGYHGYWPTDLDPAHPSTCYGTKDELKALVDAAHAKGLKVIFDHALVHVHSSSAIFKTHPDWFWTKNGASWCICGTAGCGWDPFTEEGKKCWFTDYLPHWNYTVQAARDFSVKAALDWVNQYAIDGLRLDAIKHVDDSWLLQLRDGIDKSLVTTPRPFYMVGETFTGDISQIQRFVGPTMLDGQFDFPERAQIVSAVLRRGRDMIDLSDWMDTHENDYPSAAIMSPFVGNHDLGRVIHEAEDVPKWGGEWEDGKGTSRVEGWSKPLTQLPVDSAYERLANAFAILATNKGAPLIYYGDEIGLPGAGDPDNRRMMPWTGWSASQTTLRGRIQKLLRIRADHLSTRYGTRTTLNATAEVWAYSRVYKNDKLYVVVNRGDSPAQVTLPSGNLTELLAGATGAGPTVTVPPRQTRIYAAM